MFQETINIIKQAVRFSTEIKAQLPQEFLKKPENKKFTIALMSSTQQEFDAIINLLDNVQELEIENDDSLIYYSATISNNSKTLDVILPYPLGMGLEASVISTTKIINNFSPNLIVMFGICAGNKNSTNIGDLIIADKTVNYSNVVEIEKKGNSKKKFMQNADSINKNLRSRLALFTNSPKVKELFDQLIYPESYTRKPQCHIGLMVTGSSLVRSGEKMSEINDSYHGVKGMDMETHGLYFAACNSNKEKPPLYVSMKAVSDFGDETSHKLSSTERSAIALNVSANCAKLFILEYCK